jgi:hypothetical protein
MPEFRRLAALEPPEHTGTAAWGQWDLGHRHGVYGILEK